MGILYAQSPDRDTAVPWRSFEHILLESVLFVLIEF